MIRVVYDPEMTSGLWIGLLVLYWSRSIQYRAYIICSVTEKVTKNLLLQKVRSTDLKTDPFVSLLTKFSHCVK